MRRSFILWAIILTTCSVLLGIFGNLATNTISISSQFVPWIWAIVILLWLVSVIGAIREIRHPAKDAQTAAANSLGSVADQLAVALRESWRSEEERQRLNDPFPIPLRWATAPTKLVDHWANINRAGRVGDSQPLVLEGSFESILSVYRRVPSHRLAILGGGGSGKSALAIRFLLNFIEQRASGTQVPAIFDVGSWNPIRISLRDWLVTQLERDHPGLFTQSPDGKSAAHALVYGDRVIPILDGFDEINEPLRLEALTALNNYTGPMLLTSRLREYEAATKACDVLTAAAAIVIEKLTVKDLEPYLKRSSRTSPVIDGMEDMTATTVWDSVIVKLRLKPSTPEAERLLSALSTPLMASLARMVYSDRQDRDPNELMNPKRFAKRLDIEDHLLDAFLGTVYQRHALDRQLTRRYRSWKEEEASKWLGYLAAHMNRLDSRGLAWWEIRESVGESARQGLFCIGFGLIGLASVLPIVGFRSNPLGYLVLPGGIGYGVVAGRFAGSRIVGPEPTRTHLRLRGRAYHLMRGIGSGLLFGARAGVLYGVVFSIVFSLNSAMIVYANSPHPEGEGPGYLITVGLMSGLITGVITGLNIAIVAAAAIGVGVGVVLGLQVPIDVKTVVGPFDSLRRDHLKAIWLALTVGIGMSAWFVVGSGFTIWIIPGVVSGFAFGFGVAAYQTAWGHWLLIARIWLPITGQLPWRTRAFLVDAHARGVVRQAGAVYQFRHARLQDRLASKHKRGHESA